MNDPYPQSFIEIIRNSVIEMGRHEVVDFHPHVGSFKQAANDDISMIGIMGDKLSGFIALCTENQLLRQTIPIEVEEDKELVDWYMEMSNQLLGFIKGNLHKIHLDLNASVPQLVTRQDFYNFEQSVAPIGKIDFSSSKGLLTVFYCFRFDKDIDFGAQGDPSQVVGEPGSGIVF